MIVEHPGPGNHHGWTASDIRDHRMADRRANCPSYTAGPDHSEPSALLAELASYGAGDDVLAALILIRHYRELLRLAAVH